MYFIMIHFTLFALHFILDSNGALQDDVRRHRQHAYVN